MVFVADSHVFDFDLLEPLVLPIEDYIRLQFTPASEGYHVFGMLIEPRKELPYWELSAYETNAYVDSNRPTPMWEDQFQTVFDIDFILNRERVR